MVQRLLIVGCLLAIVIGAAAMLPVTAGSRTVYVCQHCTAHQTRWRYLGFTYVEIATYAREILEQLGPRVAGAGSLR